MTQNEPTWRPVFEPGQVITAEQLNRLFDSLSDHARFATRHFHGHGILFGLRSSLNHETREWCLEAGAAIDKHGRLILVEEPLTISLDSFPMSEPGSPHPYIAEDVAIDRMNMTPVLIGRDRTQNAGGEGEPHDPGLRKIASFEVVGVQGRVTAQIAPAYALTPISFPRGLRLSDGAQFVRAFQQTKRAALQILDGNHNCNERVRSFLTSLRTSKRLEYGLPTSADILAVALLNDVVYTLWQWARAGQYLELHENHQESPLPSPTESLALGVPLGWMYQGEKAGWNWDGRWRSGFAIGLSRLEHIVGYSPVTIREICNERLAAIALASEHLAPLQSDDVRSSQEVRPDTWTISPFEYEGGTNAWLRQLRFDRPRREACFWPLDPLRGSKVAPAIVEPLPRNSEDPRSPKPGIEINCPAPNLIDPVNDPYQFCRYSDTTRLDRWQEGLVSVACLTGFPLSVVRSVLLQREQSGNHSLPSFEVVAVEDEAAMASLEVATVLSLHEPIIAIVEGETESTQAVLAFAHRVITPGQSGQASLKPTTSKPKSKFFRNLKQYWEGLLWAIRG